MASTDQITEYLSPSDAIMSTAIPRTARGVIWLVGSMFAACVAALGLIHVDRVVTVAGRVVSQASTIIVQPLETSIVRSLDVRSGQKVRAGDLLARLDSTFATADVGALQSQVASQKLEVERLQAEVEGRRFEPSIASAWAVQQATIFARRAEELNSKREFFRQKIAALQATVARSQADAAAYEQRLVLARELEAIRTQLETQQFGSRLHTLEAADTRLELERNLKSVTETGVSATAELAAATAERDGVLQNWIGQTGQTLSDASRKLGDAQAALDKALLRRKLVELRADRDATVLTVSKLSEGSVLQPGEPVITLVPTDAPLEVEVNIPGRDIGFVRSGNDVAIKLDTFPFSQYGMAAGSVRMISPDSFSGADQQVGRVAGAVPVPQNSTEAYYRSRIAIDRVELHDVPENFQVTPGMPVTADIKVGQMTVMGYLMGRVLAITSEGMREP